LPEFSPEAYGRYYLIDRIAIGGMAEIFKAKTYSDAGFEKLQVVKRILSHLSENDDFISMFVDEAKISVELQHANIVQIYDFGRLGTNYFIAMECVDGKDVKHILRKLAERGKLLPEEFAVFMVHEACKGLDHAHKKSVTVTGEPMNIIHRDMSPSNVLVSYSGEIKIADFGIAKAEARAYTTKGGVLKGKFEYMSPEQARGENVTQLSDIFSTGIILWEMLTGRRLFKTDSEIKTLEKIKNLDFGPPSQMNPNIPARLDAIVMKALAGEPDNRYQSAQEFQAALLDYMYPSTPTVIARSLARFMEELFTDERETERQALERGSAVALELREQPGEIDLEAEWEESPAGGSGTLHTPVQQPTRAPLVVAVAAVLGLVVLSGLLVWTMANNEPAPTTPTQVPLFEGARLTVKIQPAVQASVFIGDELQGTGSKVVLRDLPAGETTVRVLADGYQPGAATVDLEQGVRSQVSVTLVAQDAPPEDPADPVATPPNLRQPPTVTDGPAVASPPTTPPTDATPQPSDQPVDGAETTPPEPVLPSVLRFESSPAGATIRIDGSRYAKTPASFEAEPGRSYRVSYLLDGHDSASFTAVGPASETTETFARTLPAKVVAMGKLNVNVRAGWAYVYVDGKKLSDTTPLFGHSLRAGNHTIRVVNEALGLDESRKVTVSAGETATVAF